ncbi:MAG: hypothetical protein HY924_15280 [Elusimicrobia bacterium]|nr:hypothetical protein [Elusimicrobiota bacterium]
MTDKKKKPYAKPKLESEKIVETSTLACGKCTSGPSGIGSPPCKSVRKNS